MGQERKAYLQTHHAVLVGLDMHIVFDVKWLAHQCGSRSSELFRTYECVSCGTLNETELT